MAEVNQVEIDSVQLLEYANQAKESTADFLKSYAKSPTDIMGGAADSAELLLELYQQRIAPFAYQTGLAIAGQVNLVVSMANLAAATQKLKTGISGASVDFISALSGITQSFGSFMVVYGDALVAATGSVGSSAATVATGENLVLAGSRLGTAGFGLNVGLWASKKYIPDSSAIVMAATWNEIIGGDYELPPPGTYGDDADKLEQFNKTMIANHAARQLAEYADEMVKQSTLENGNPPATTFAQTVKNSQAQDILTISNGSNGVISHYDPVANTFTHVNDNTGSTTIVDASTGELLQWSGYTNGDGTTWSGNIREGGKIVENIHKDSNGNLIERIATYQIPGTLDHLFKEECRAASITMGLIRI